MFTADAQVVSPLYGIRPADDFNADLFRDTQQSRTTLLTVFDSADTAGRVALHFRYDWTMADGSDVTFECVDVFELDEAGARFTKLTIHYDTAPLRKTFEGL